MTISLRHAFTSAQADGPDATQIRPSNWNEPHVLTMSASFLLGRLATGDGPAEELSLVAGANVTITPNAAARTITIAAASGSGDVTGPASAVNARFASFSGTTGKVIADSGFSSASFAAATHVHTIANVTGLQTALDAKAPLASPALTGTPTAPTAAKDANSTQLATTAYADRANRNLTQNAQTGTTYTPVAADAGEVVTLTNAAAITCTINASVFAGGDRVDFIQLGAGQVTFAAGAGFTLRSSGSKLKMSGQYSGATLYFLSASEAVLIGDITT